MGRVPKISYEQWESLEWEGRTARSLANELGCTVQFVLRWAKKLGKTLVADVTGPKSRVDWSVIDWSRSNPDLARELGFSREWISEMRKRSGR